MPLNSQPQPGNQDPSQLAGNRLSVERRVLGNTPEGMPWSANVHRQKGEATNVLDLQAGNPLGRYFVKTTPFERDAKGKVVQGKPDIWLITNSDMTEHPVAVSLRRSSEARQSGDPVESDRHRSVKMRSLLGPKGDDPAAAAVVIGEHSSIFGGRVDAIFDVNVGQVAATSEKPLSTKSDGTIAELAFGLLDGTSFARDPGDSADPHAAFGQFLELNPVLADKIESYPARMQANVGHTALSGIVAPPPVSGP